MNIKSVYREIQFNDRKDKLTGLTQKKDLKTEEMQGDHVEELEAEIAERIGNENLVENVKILHQDLDAATKQIEDLVDLCDDKLEKVVSRVESMMKI